MSNNINFNVDLLPTTDNTFNLGDATHQWKNIYGNASSATKLTGSVGSTTQPVYFSDGKPIVTDSLPTEISIADIENSFNNTEYKYYGLKIDKSLSDPAAACTYIDDAEGMTAGWDNWKDSVLFKNIRPCLVKDGKVISYLQRDNMTLKDDGTTATLTTIGTDVMVEIPKIGYAMSTDANYHYIWLTNNPDAEGYCYAAHSKETLGDCDYIYIGAYDGYVNDSKLYSISGITPTVNISLNNSRTYANSRGDGYELFSFFPLTLLQCMFLIIYKNRNGQAALGNGYTGASALGTTGTTASQSFCYGTTANSTTHMKFLGIEDFWGHVWQWLDGYRTDSNYNILTYYKNMSSVGSGTNYQYKTKSNAQTISWTWIKDIVGTTYGGFTPATIGSSATTYWSDCGGFSPSCCAIFGAEWNDGSGAGLFYLDVNCSASSSYSSLAARLLLKHVAN